MFSETDLNRVPLVFDPRTQKIRTTLRFSFLPKHGVDGQIVVPNCLVDTGATMTLIPEQFWNREKFRNTALANYSHRRKGSGLGGGMIEFIPHVVRAQILGLDNGFSRIIDLGECEVGLALDGLNSKSPMRHGILGVGGGCMGKGGLCLNWKSRSAHYVEVASV